MLREDTALAGLKAQLGANYTALGMNPPADAVDSFLMRYVRSSDLIANKAIEALKQRREFERAMPGVSVTSFIVSSLRSGAFAVIGEDTMHRPILHIRLGNFRTSSDSYDTDRLVFVLLEYMQGLAMRHFSEAGVDGNGIVDANGGANSTRGSKVRSRAASSMSASPATAQCQEIVILMQDHDGGGGSGGIFANRGTQLISRIVSLATKYFPNLIGGILMVDIGWTAQQTLRTNAAVQRVLDVVKAEHLGRFIDPSIIPEDLGGKKVKIAGRMRNQACVEANTPQDFSQIVLRHWFNTVSVIVSEENQIRPLWQPLPLYFNFSSESKVGSGGTETPRFGGSVSRRRGASRSETGSARGGQFGEEDDGICSVITDDPTTVDGDGDGAGGLAEEDARGLQAELDAERARRIQLENELTKLTLGITLDETTLTRLEEALKAIHGDVNVLISEVVQKSKASTSAATGRSAAGGPSLNQLIDATNRAVLQAIQEREEVPAMKFAAMKFAQPTERRGKKSCVIC